MLLDLYMVIEIHPSAKISKLADIEDSIRGSKIIISSNVVIDSFVKIKPAGGIGDILIGSNSIINSGCVLYSGNGITIGKYVAIAANCTLAPVSHEYARRELLIMSQGFRPSKGGILINDDVWIGANCVILDGVQIGFGCVIGASSLVRENLDNYGIYVGNPLKRIGVRQ
ncbi:MAG: acyltransferase [Woronichinia naegeliana WA131]|uniref:Acyltransferase n=1 Tax=Woronichinia naegeliana WA131 TaxID=2824559 RepID=A0A977KW42_9CYAN|nr:MAG: acyltransferase [Woronichinia naegeliana WA131]